MTASMFDAKLGDTIAMVAFADMTIPAARLRAASRASKQDTAGGG
jgi:hypothetical protein